MDVLINALSARVGGGLSYIARQTSATSVVLAERGSRQTILVAPWNEESLSAALCDAPNTTITPVAVRSVGQRFLYEQTILPLIARDFDVLYCPGNFAPMFSAGAPTVLTIQNPNYFGFGRRLPQNAAWNRRAKILLSHASVRRAHAVVVISDWIGDQVLDDVPSIRDRVHNVPSGRPDPPAPVQPVSRPDGKFFLSVANDYAHKRLTDLAQAFARCRESEGVLSSSLSLVFVGDISASRREDIIAAARSKDAVVFAGAVSHPGEVRWYMEHALAMVSASELEAHPLTPAEAGAAGCPTILSDIGPHREVAPAQTEFFSVGDIATLASLMVRVYRDPRPRIEWKYPVSWLDNARALVEVFSNASGGAE